MKTISNCFAALRRIRTVRRSVTNSVLKSLVVSLVLPRIDYGSVTLAGLPRQLLDKLQSVMNAATRSVFSVRKYDHVTPLLRDLHWYGAPQLIEFRLAVLAYRCQHGLAPPYLLTQLHRVSDVESKRRLRSASTTALVVLRTHYQTIGDPVFPIAAAHMTHLEQSFASRYDVGT